MHGVLNWRNPLHGDDNNQMILALFWRWSSKSSKSSTERLVVDSFRSACLHVKCMTPKKNKKTLQPFSDPQFAAFVPSLHAQSQSGNLLTFILGYVTFSLGCYMVCCSIASLAVGYIFELFSLYSLASYDCPYALKIKPSPWYKGGWWNPSLDFFDIFEYFKWKAFDLLNKMRYILWVVVLLDAYDVTNNDRPLGHHLEFYQELEIRLREMIIFCAWHKK